MSGDLVLGLGMLTVGSMLTGVTVALWTGRLTIGGQVASGSNVDRFYLMLPFWLMLVVIGSGYTLDTLGAPQGVTRPLAAAFLPVGLVGFVLAIWQPERLRPAWQRHPLELQRRHDELLASADEQGHDFIVLLTVDQDEEPVTSAADAEVARTAARLALDARPDAQLATVRNIAELTTIATLQRDQP